MPQTYHGQPENGNSVVPQAVFEVHPSAARRTNNLIIQSENTTYTDEHITSDFWSRGAQVQVINGQHIVSPTVEQFQFQTVRAVGKTGYRLFFLTTTNCLTLLS